jgi:hypothetical protein
VATGSRGEKWVAVDNLIIVVGQVYITPTSPSIAVVLAAAHGTGHEGAERTLHHLRADFYILGACTMVWACATCQRNKDEHLHPVGLLQLLEVPSTAWSDVAMDFVEGFPRLNGKSVIITVVDRFSKYAHFIPISHPYIATSVARAFFNDIVQLHDIPSSIVSNQDRCSQAASDVSSSVVRLSSAFHPETDDQSEAANKA